MAAGSKLGSSLTKYSPSATRKHFVFLQYSTEGQTNKNLNENIIKNSHQTRHTHYVYLNYLIFSSSETITDEVHTLKRLKNIGLSCKTFVKHNIHNRTIQIMGYFTIPAA